MQPLHYRAFTTPTGGGNPAGVLLDASGADDAAMLALAAELGYSETAFAAPLDDGAFRVRYFSPLAEVDFCGHATIATAVALAEHAAAAPGDTPPRSLRFATNVGDITVDLEHDADGVAATLGSVPPETAPLEPERLAELLRLIGWSEGDLDSRLPSGLAFAGLWHPIVWAGSRARLASLDYDFDGLAELMRTEGWGTVSLLFRESPSLIRSRNAFPIGGVVEDPATGAAAAALGGFLRAHRLLPADGRVTVMQGEDLGVPCRLEIDASGEGGIRVRGTARRIPDPA